MFDLSTLSAFMQSDKCPRWVKTGSQAAPNFTSAFRLKLDLQITVETSEGA